MAKVESSDYLSGQLLVAMPDMMDSRFDRCVILLIYHSDENAMGVVINQTAGQMHVGAFAEDGSEVCSSAVPVHYGGPVDDERAIIVHTGDCKKYMSTKVINDEFSVTTTPDILEDMTQGEGPSSALLALGYAGWFGGQLEAEIKRNTWLICKANPKLVFETADDKKWEAALRSLGINPGMLSPGGGSA